MGEKKEERSLIDCLFTEKMSVTWSRRNDKKKKAVARDFEKFSKKTEGVLYRLAAWEKTTCSGGTNVGESGGVPYRKKRTDRGPWRRKEGRAVTVEA